jgi:hypothetical protein
MLRPVRNRNHVFGHYCTLRRISFKQRILDQITWYKSAKLQEKIEEADMFLVGLFNTAITGINMLRARKFISG